MSDRTGEQLPQETIDVTPTFIISTALATRDFQDVHHDRDLAQAKGSKDIFVNILTTTGLVQRYVSAWAGHVVGSNARVGKVDIRLGVPCYAYETLVLSGEVVSWNDGTIEIAVTGAVSLGNHVTGTVLVRTGGRS